MRSWRERDKIKSSGLSCCVWVPKVFMNRPPLPNQNFVLQITSFNLHRKPTTVNIKSQYDSPLTAKTWLLILPFSSDTFLCKSVGRIWWWVKIATYLIISLSILTICLLNSVWLWDITRSSWLSNARVKGFITVLQSPKICFRVR